MRRPNMAPALSALSVVAASVCAAAGEAPVAVDTATAVRREATLPNDGPGGRPLPLIGAWCTGSHRWSAGWRPVEQLKLLEQGFPIIPWFAHPNRLGDLDGEAGERFVDYYGAAIRQAAELGLPLTFVASQWEAPLSAPPYHDLPADQNPNIVDTEGNVRKAVSPFGPVAPWREIGRTYTNNPLMRQLQQWYPEPPLVVFLSNNEHGKLRWHQAEESQRYLDTHGRGRDADYRRKLFADAWVERYRALQEAMRSGLSSVAWRDAARFVGYSTGPPEFMGRWGGWVHYSLHSPGRISPYPLMWDGGSPSYYMHDWCPTTDHTAWSPQIEFMNAVFALRQGYRQNPEWWLELSTWDGHEWPWRKKTPSKTTVYETSGQVWNPTRHQGFLQYGLWLLQPRLLREYRGWTTPWDKAEPTFVALAEAVAKVHKNPRLTAWWRRSELVPNRSRQHIHQAGIPEEYRNEDRWFMLECDANPDEFPWELHWQVAVFSLARVRGKAPQRQWLVYAHSPLQKRDDVAITVPGFGTITVDVGPGGAFFEMDETAKSVSRID